MKSTFMRGIDKLASSLVAVLSEDDSGGESSTSHAAAASAAIRTGKKNLANVDVWEQLFKFFSGFALRRTPPAERLELPQFAIVKLLETQKKSTI